MAERGGPAGWGTVAALAVSAAVLSVTNPGLLLLVPFAVLALALPPRRPAIALGALLMVVLVLSGPRGGLLWYFERGWALLAAAWFVVMVVALPRQGFLVRALGAVLAAELTATAFLAANRGSFERLEAAVSGRLREAATSAVSGWQRLGAPAGDGEGGGIPLSELVYRFAELQVMLFPALLALATLAGLAVAWWGFRRLSAGEREPLAPLREFRFPNDLVWLLIVGLALLLLPAGAAAGRVGSNLLTFMAALYALRGVAVLLVIGGAPGPLGVLVGLLAVLFLYPLVMAATVLVGLTDTWLDIRARRRASRTG
ncbi:MAG TPA: DUF2232 domain-containing protein [Longimicrobiales bacterium]|nr:DUF2232 domain-containing protein [Longimicrobiales bacterium]